MLAHTPTILQAKKGSYEIAQGELARRHFNSSSVVMVDLSTMIQQRGTERLLPGTKAEGDFSVQIVGLDAALQSIAEGKPRAIFVDWQITLPPSFRADQEDKFQFAPEVSEEFQDNYLALMQTVATISKTIPVILLGDGTEDVRSKGTPVFPAVLPNAALVTCLLQRGELAPYVPFAPMGLSSVKLPAFTDEVISRLELQDRLSGAPSKWGLFQAQQSLKAGNHFWINYGFAPALLADGVFLTGLELKDPSTRSRLKDRIVVIADITVPRGDDKIELPVGPERDDRRLGSGGFAHACALLTRTESPIYALPEGCPEIIITLIANILVGLCTIGLGSWTAKFVQEALKERVELLFELFAFIGVSLIVLLCLPAWFARHDLLVIQTQGFLICRFLDLLGIVLVTLWGIRGVFRLPKKKSQE